MSINLSPNTRLCRSAKGIYTAAQEANRGGDEELAFIFYMRYITIIKSLQKKADYRNKQTELTAMFGGNDSLLNALNTAEVLRKSLIARYSFVLVICRCETLSA